MRFLHLVASLGERGSRALVVDPDSNLKEADRAAAVASLSRVRGSSSLNLLIRDVVE